MTEVGSPAASPANESAAASAGSWRTLVILSLTWLKRAAGSFGVIGTTTRVGTNWLPAWSSSPVAGADRHRHPQLVDGDPEPVVVQPERAGDAR